MIERDKIYNLLAPVKGWPAREAKTLEEASHMILGSPYWQIPEDTYKIIDKNETYSLLAVYKNGRISWDKRYLALNMKLIEKIELVSEKSG
ncbi:MAG: hypothetical protein JSV88_14980 [Candidatus Aminicenantes bacterium]|nr:MAG: hypothetical protein JSV88_14980 [Candidatus Aminicenantes bacterium]